MYHAHSTPAYATNGEFNRMSTAQACRRDMYPHAWDCDDIGNLDAPECIMCGAQYRDEWNDHIFALPRTVSRA